MLKAFKTMENRGLSDSLFSALRKYPKSQELDPIENFLTEGFAWVCIKSMRIPNASKVFDVCN
jgi:hypothetical protein